MEFSFSKPSTKKLTSLSISNPLNYLNYLLSQSPHSSSSSHSPQFKTLISPKPSHSSIFNPPHFLTKPTSHPSISSSGSSWFRSPTHPSSISPHFASFSGTCCGGKNQVLNLQLLKSYSYYRFRWFSLVSIFDNDARVGGVNPKQVSDIIELIRRGGDEMESKLNSMNVSLSVASAVKIFRVLNTEEVPALRFLDWIKLFQPELYYNSDVCSMAIDNCGRLDDYLAMQCLLSDFNENQVCLTDKAFGFLTVMISSKESSTRNCIERVIEVLNRVGGSSCVSGVRALIEVLSVLGSFEMAKYVIIKSQKKPSYYNILIRVMCRRSDFKGALSFLNEIRQDGCELSTQTYNYVISTLCKNGKNAEARKLLKEMEERNCADAATYEIFIWNCCRVGEFDVAFQYLDNMAARGLVPRHSTHAAFIKSYCSLRQFKEAYEYVVNSANKYKRSSNMMYCLLATLHLKNNNAVIAHDVLLDMINKRLRPDLAVYKKVLKRLQKSGREDLAGYLTTEFSSLSSKSEYES